MVWGLYTYLWAFVLYVVQMTLVVRRMPTLKQRADRPVARKAGEHG